MFSRKFLTQKEILNMLDEESESEEVVQAFHRANKVDFIILPPRRVDNVSDEKELDENEQVMEDKQVSMSSEVAGEIEVLCAAEDGELIGNNEPEKCANDVVETSDSLQQILKLSKWTRRIPVSFSKQPINNESLKLENVFEAHGTKSPLELYELFIDDKIINLIVSCTENYARSDGNDLSFKTTAKGIRKFIGILFLSGINTRPTLEHY